MTKTHTCHAKGCDDPCPPSHLMCKACWSLVSAEAKRAVYDTYTSGQCNRPELIKGAWLTAARRAIMEVDRKKKAAAPKPVEAAPEKRTLF